MGINIKRICLALATMTAMTALGQDRPPVTDTIMATRCGRSLGKHTATYYRTDGSRVHRKHPTAAYNYAPIGTMLVITNLSNNKSCTVEVTDRMGNRGRSFIDLSVPAFGMIADHSTGVINVSVKTID